MYFGYDTNTNTQMRVYRTTIASGSTYDNDYPIIPSRTLAAGITEESYAAVYGQINADNTKVPTINICTGKVTAPSFAGDGSLITNVNALKVNGFTVGKAVPSDAVFTDTKYTATKANVGSASEWSAGTMFAASVNTTSHILTLTSGTKPTLTVTSTSVVNDITAS